MKKLTFFVASAAIMLAACSEPLQEEAEINKSKEPTKVEKTISHWGNKIEDPYTVKNMRRAYDELTKGETQSLTKKGLQKEQITTTHLSVKFIPKDENEWRILKLDTILDVVPIPFDYDLEGFDGNYRDPECPAGQPTYQYSVVRIGYPLPNIEYVVLDSLFMPFEDEYEQTSLSKKTGMKQIWDELETESMKLTGNWEDDDENNILSKKKSRDTPAGDVTMKDFSLGITNGVPDVVVHLNFSTHRSNAITHSDGTWKSSHSFKNKVHAHVYFSNANYYACHSNGDEIGWYYGKEKLYTDTHFQLKDKDKANYAATIMKAAYDYYNNKKDIKRPPTGKKIQIGLKTNNNGYAIYYTTEFGGHFIDSNGSEKIFIVESTKCKDNNKLRGYNVSDEDIYGKNMEIYTTTIYGLAYSSIKQFAKVFSPAEHDLLNESYLACVAYVFGKDRYSYLYKPEDYRSNYTLHNSGFFIDMIDDIDPSNADYVTNYTLPEIEDIIANADVRILKDVVTTMPKYHYNSTSNKLEDLLYHWHCWSEGYYSHK